MVLVSLFGQLIVQSISHFFGRPKNKLSILRDRTISFVHSLEKFCAVFFDNLSLSNMYLDWTKKIKRVDKEKFPVLRVDNCFLANQKNEKLTRQLVGQETDQNHMDVPKSF